MKQAHLIGNGPSAGFYDPENAPGIKLTCNLPPFQVRGALATAIVDFKMMRAIQEGSVQVPGDWVLGYRPRIHMDRNPSFYMKVAPQIREFYLTKPPYVPNYTDFNCGHMACHYLSSKHRPNVIHLYGFDSLFDFDLRSCTDFYLESSRDHVNTERLSKNWRRIWPHLFNEFPNIQYKLHGKHKHLKIDAPKNVEVVVHKK